MNFGVLQSDPESEVGTFRPDSHWASSLSPPCGFDPTLPHSSTITLRELQAFQYPAIITGKCRGTRTVVRPMVIDSQEMSL